MTRTLFILNRPAFPVIGGAPLRNWQNIQLLKRLGEVAIFSIAPERSQWGSAPPGIETWQLLRPRPASGMNALQQRFWWLRGTGHAWADHFYDPAHARALDTMIDRFRPDLIVLEEIWLHRYLPRLLKAGVPVVYDAHNVESALARQLDQPGNRGTLVSRKLDNLARIERTVLRQVSQVWSCSETDRSGLSSEMTDDSQCLVIPNGIDLSGYEQLAAPAPPSPTHPFSIMYMGTYGYEPNAEAAQVLLDVIFPAVRERVPTARLYLVGHRPTANMQHAAQTHPDIHVTGRVDSVLPYLQQTHVVAVPLQAGSGTRLKILEAFAARRPVVSTRKGAEGLASEDGKHILLHDDPREMAAELVRLAKDWSRATRMTAAAYELARNLYGWDAVAPRIQAAVEHLVGESK